MYISKVYNIINMRVDTRNIIAQRHLASNGN